jgi:hypothetical protein
MAPLFALLLVFVTSFDQTDQTLADIETALKAGSAKELVKFCSETVELKIDGQSANYSRTQAEVVLRNFFNKNPVKEFSYIHQGASPEGLKYSIGKYTFNNGSYRVVMFLKKSGKTYTIDTLNFSRE